MLLIKKGLVPEKLLAAKKNGCIRYDNLPSGVKQAIRTHLCKEQHGLCAYCMARVTDTRDFPIEHIIPRSTPLTGDGLSLDWKNMVLSCDGGSGNNQSCDAIKSNKPLASLSPLDDACMKRIFYSPSGRIKSENDQYKHDLEEVLNLNNTLLVYKRKQIITLLNRRESKRSGNKQAWKSHLLLQLENVQRPDGNGELPPLVGVSIWYLRTKYEKLSPGPQDRGRQGSGAEEIKQKRS